MHTGPAVVFAAGLPSGATSRLQCCTAVGTILWTVTANGYIMRRVAIHAGRVYVATSDGLKIWNLRDGSYVGGYFPAYNVSDVCVHPNGTIYIVTRDNATYTITVRALSGNTGEPLWNYELIGLPDSDFDWGNRGRVALNRLGTRLAVIGVSQTHGESFANLWVLATRDGACVWRGLTYDSSAGQATAIRWDAASNLYLGDKNGKLLKYRYDGAVLQNWFSSINNGDISDFVVDHRYLWLGHTFLQNLWRYIVTDLGELPEAYVGWAAGTQMALNAENQFYVIYYSTGSNPRDPIVCRINHEGTEEPWLWNHDLLTGNCYNNAGCAVLSRPEVPVWEDDHAYVVADVVRYHGAMGTWRYFYCTTEHTSSGDTMPGFGKDWEAVWDEDDWERYNL